MAEPSRFAPTIIGTALGEPAKVTTLAGAPLAAPMQPVAASAPTALPGVVRCNAVSPQDIQTRFPAENPALIAEVVALLVAPQPAPGDSAGWLAWGESSQRAVSSLIAARVAAGENAALRAAARHLARLHELFGEQAASFSGGSLLRPADPQRCWSRLRPEVEQLAAMLDRCLPELLALHRDAGQRSRTALSLRQSLRANGLAADVLGSGLPEAARDLLLGRKASLLASEALLGEIVLQIDADQVHIESLLQQIRDGVLVRLPALLNALAAVPARPNETERFTLLEKLNDFVCFLQERQ